MSSFDRDAKQVRSDNAAAAALRPDRADARSDVPIATGQPLDSECRATMEARFGHDFTDVRVHADQAAARSARALGARAFAQGRNVVFGRGEYAPHSTRGKELLAHELAHVVQQQRHGPGDGAEERADAAAARVVRGQDVDAAQLGAAAQAVQCQPIEDEGLPPLPKFEFTPFSVPYRMLGLVPPSLYPPLSPPLSLGESPGSQPLPPLSETKITPPQGQDFKYPSLPAQGLGSTTAAPSLDEPARLNAGADDNALAPKATQYTPPPAVPGQAAPPSGADLPSRVGVAEVGQFSLGLRFGLPTPKQAMPGTPPDRRPQELSVPGAGASVRSYSDFQFELLNMHMTGVPEGFAAIDMGELMKVSFSILSTHIAPDLFRQLSESVAGREGLPFQFDITVTGGLDGFGLTFQMPFDEAPKPYRGPEP